MGPKCSHVFASTPMRVPMTAPTTMMPRNSWAVTPSGCAAARRRFSAQMRAGSRNDFSASRPIAISMRAEAPPRRNPSDRPTGLNNLKAVDFAGCPRARRCRACARAACREPTSRYPAQPALTPAAQAQMIASGEAAATVRLSRLLDQMLMDTMR